MSLPSGFLLHLKVLVGAKSQLKAQVEMGTVTRRQRGKFRTLFTHRPRTYLQILTKFSLYPCVAYNGKGGI